ncbi:unnamed protein product, partial [Mesorhabditis spiculigera]
MDRLYQETSAQVNQVHTALARLEVARDENEAQYEMQSINAQLRDIQENYDRLQIYVSKEPPQRRHVAKMKIDQLYSDYQNSSQAVTNIYTRISARWRAAAQREELLRQRVDRTNGGVALTINDHELMVHDRLEHSNRGVDDLINQGAEVLNNLRTQHLNLRGVRRKIFDIGATLGLSDTTLRMIDRRVREDWLIFVVACNTTYFAMASGDSNNAQENAPKTLADYEAMFAGRYSSQDPDYAKIERGFDPTICIHPWGWQQGGGKRSWEPSGRPPVF